MKKNKAPSIVAIAVLTLITVVFWIFFSVLRLLSTKPAVSVPDEILAPINPTLDTNVLNSLQQRYYLEAGQIPEFQYSLTTVSEIETPEEIQFTETETIATPSASPPSEPGDISQ